MQLPTFNLLDQAGNTHTNEDFKGNWLVLYTYPKDDTPGCTAEACLFRDEQTELAKLGVSLLGVSKDTVKSHKKFADKFELNFPILADPTHELIEKLGAWGKKKFMGKEYDGTLRNTYIINPDGEIVKTYEKVDPKTNPTEVFNDLRFLLTNNSQ